MRPVVVAEPQRDMVSEARCTAAREADSAEQHVPALVAQRTRARAALRQTLAALRAPAAFERLRAPHTPAPAVASTPQASWPARQERVTLRPLRPLHCDGQSGTTISFSSLALLRSEAERSALQPVARQRSVPHQPERTTVARQSVLRSPAAVRTRVVRRMVPVRQVPATSGMPAGIRAFQPTTSRAEFLLVALSPGFDRT